MGFVEEFVEKFTSSYQYSAEQHEVRLANGELVETFGVNWNFLLLGNGFYFTTLITLVLWMASKSEKFQLFNFMRLYNFTCVLAAGSVVFYVITDIIQHGPLKFVGNVKALDANTERGARLQFAMWLFYIQKFWEFLDSFVFILRGKMRQLSFLHVYHHSSVTFMVFSFIYYSGSGDLIWGALINSFVHVLMYSHYLLSTFKVNTWWKKYITQLQLVQFMVYLVQVVLHLTVTPLEEGWPYFLRVFVLFYDLTLIGLFLNFYIKSYTKSKKAKKDAKKD